MASARVLQWAAPLSAQVGLASASTAVALSATKVASVSVSLPGGNSATLPGALVTGPNDFTPIPVSTAWSVDPQRTTSVALVGYFDRPARALARDAAGGTLVLFTQAISGANPVGGRSDNLQVRIDLTGAPELPAGGYTGTLSLLMITQ